MSETNQMRKVDSRTADLICSGQVITSLFMVAKELLENALDAGANHVEIRLKEYGKESIEVVDNGQGIAKDDFEKVVGKHNTSKLKQLQDLADITSYGFRGEALSSICALAKVVIQTRQQRDEVGTELHFDSEGNVVKKEMVARRVGTTVLVQDLFFGLPVRRKEFVNNYTREYGKLIKGLQGYCLGLTGVKIACSNSCGNNKTNDLVSTGISVKSNITDVFGRKQLDNLIEFKQIVDAETEQNQFTVTGFVSKCDSGMGRSSSDRQYFLVNKRPCHMKSLAKIINEVYRNFNSKQFPFVLLSIKVIKNAVDFNVTPDKKEVFIAEEEKIFDNIKESLTEMYNRTSGCDVVSLSKLSQISNLEVWSQKGKKRDSSEVDREVSLITTSTPIKMSRSRSPCDSPFKEVSHELSQTTLSLIPFDVDDAILNEAESVNLQKNSSNQSFQRNDETLIRQNSKEENNETSLDEQETSSELKTRIEVDPEDDHSDRHEYPLDISLEMIRKMVEKQNNNNNFSRNKNPIFTENFNGNKAEDELKNELKKHMFKEMKVLGQFNLGFIITKLNNDLFIIDQHASDERFNYESLLENTVINMQHLVTPIPLEVTALTELIIQNHLSEFKAHKFNFSINEKAPPGKRMKLLTVPCCSLNLQKDWIGTKDDIDELVDVMCESPGRLKSDYKLSSLLPLIASRACRSSIMIRDSLPLATMNKVVRQMSDLKNPWHCAHHRPTIRHLVNLKKLY